jgi:hypothetical protein
VHQAEAITIRESGHSQVACALCHVGSGTANLVKSKVQGLSEILPTVTGNYASPIPAPLEKHIPSTQTCQTCHPATKYYGDVLLARATFATDKSNTRCTSALVLKLNGGPGDTSSGIHWHSTGKIWFMAADPQLKEFAWVATQNQSGEITQYVNPGLIGQVTAEQIQSGGRPMDCIDCHNRVAHPIRSPEQLIDNSLADGSLDTTLPFIKLVALNATSSQDTSITQAYDKIEKIRDYYQANYPDVFKTERASIDCQTQTNRRAEHGCIQHNPLYVS